MQYKFEPLLRIIERILIVLIPVSVVLVIVKDLSLVYIISLTGVLFIRDLISLHALSPYIFWLGVLVAGIGVWLLIAGENDRGGIFLAIATILWAIAFFYPKEKEKQVVK